MVGVRAFMNLSALLFRRRSTSTFNCASSETSGILQGSTSLAIGTSSLIFI